MMGWLQGNPVGAALAGLAGLLVLASVGLGLAWNVPPSSGEKVDDEIESLKVDLPPSLEPMNPMENYAVILERPVFNESRRPEADSGENEDQVVLDSSEEVTDPGVRLTGVVLTPDLRIVTLTPNNDGEPVIVREGTELEGEQLGWAVGSIDPRRVTLNSRDGRELQLDLSIHDEMIEEPPKPEPVTTEEAQAVTEGEEDDQPMSRAEEIRQRIQERREQLRREAEEAQGEATEAKATQRTSYQEAIRSLMSNSKSKQEEETDEDDQ
jgi:hypothetical protein